MAQLQRAYVQQTTQQTHTGDTAWTDVSGASMPSTSFTAGETYLLLINARAGGNHFGSLFGYRVLHGSTVFAESEMAIQPGQLISNAPYFYTFFEPWTAVASEGIKLQFKTYNSSRQAECDDITITAVRLETLTQNVDYFYNEVVSDTSLDTTWSTSGNASITIAPGLVTDIDPGDDWLVWGRSRIEGVNDPITVADDMKMESRISRTGEVTEQLPTLGQRVQDPGDFTNHFFQRVYTVNTSNTFTLQARNDVDRTDRSIRKSSALFAIRLSAFGDYAYSQPTNTDDEFELTSGAPFGNTPKASASLTEVTEATDLWTLGYANFKGGGSPDRKHEARNQISGVDVPPTQTSDSYSCNYTLDDFDIFDVFIAGMLSAPTTDGAPYDGGIWMGAGASTDWASKLSYVIISFAPTEASATTSASSSASSSASTTASSSLTTSASSTASTSQSSSASTSQTASESSSASTSLTSSSLTTSASSSASFSTASTSASTSLTVTIPPDTPGPGGDPSINPPLPDVLPSGALTPEDRMLTLNRAGNSPRNPIINGAPFQIQYHKHDANETLKSMWVAVDGVVFKNLTSRCVETEYMVTCDVTAGIDLQSNAIPLLNIINVTTEYQEPERLGNDDGDTATPAENKIHEVRCSGGVFVVNQPQNIILLDGYPAANNSFPAVFRPNESDPTAIGGGDPDPPPSNNAPIDLGAAPGTVLFDHNFGEADPYADDAFVKDSDGGTFTIESVDGVNCARLRINPAGTTVYRAEVARRRGATNNFERDPIFSERIYEVIYYIPGAWSTHDNGRCLFFQLHGSPDPGEPFRGPPLSIQYIDGELRVRQRSSSNLIDSGNPPGSWIYASPGIPTASWVSVKVEMRLSYTSSGYLRVFFNGTKLVDQTNTANSFNDADGHYVKVGQYRPKAKNNSPGDPSDSSIYVWRLRVSEPF